MKKVLIFLLLIVSIYSQENINLIKFYDEKMYKEIIKIYNAENYSNTEFKFVFTKAILSKNLEALNEFKNIEYFEQKLLNYLLELDDVKLFNYYKENNFLGEDKENYKNWICQGIEMDSENIVKELVSSAEKLNINIESLGLLNVAFEQGSFEVFTLIFDKTSRLDYLEFYSNNKDLSAKINYILQEDLKKNILNKEVLNDIVFYYLSHGEYDKTKEILEKYKEIKIERELKAKLLVLSAEKKDYKFSETLIKEDISFSESCISSEEITNFVSDKNIEKLLVEGNKELNYLLSVTINQLIENNRLEDFENILKSNYNFEDKEIQENMFYIAVGHNNLNALEILKKNKLLNFDIQSDVLDKIIVENKIEIFKLIYEKSEFKDENYNFDTLMTYTRPEMAEFIINNEATPEKQERVKLIMFIWAATKNNKEMMNYFLNKGLNINKKDEFGKTALYYVILNIDNDSCDYSELGYDTLSFLIEKGANFDKVDNKKSALMVAVERNKNAELVEFLLKSKADINYLSEDGYTAYDYVKQFNIKELDKIFKKYMKK